MIDATQVFELTAGERVEYEVLAALVSQVQANREAAGLHQQEGQGEALSCCNLSADQTAGLLKRRQHALPCEVACSVTHILCHSSWLALQKHTLQLVWLCSKLSHVQSLLLMRCCPGLTYCMQRLVGHDRLCSPVHRILCTCLPMHGEQSHCD